MNTLLQTKHIAVIVTGSIAIYKTLELIRQFIKAGSNVKVIMSESAKRFITPLTFEAISANEVLHEESESWANLNNHIAIAKWADICVIAPVSVNTIAKLAHGIADNLPTQVIAAFSGSIIIAPSANTIMYQNIATKSNLEILKNRGFIIASTQTKLLACGDIGDGAMASENEIFWLSARELLSNNFWLNRDVLITGGGTMEPIDDVRYITNASSGKMAVALARAAFLNGANVTLICVNEPLDLPIGIKVIIAKSSQSMQEALISLQKNTCLDKEPFIFMAAAVSDFAPVKQNGKIKKNQIGIEWNLKLYKTTDILASINKTGFKVIGFKAEVDERTAMPSAKAMLIDKNVDAVVLNIIGIDTEFGFEQTRLRLITKKSFDIFKLKDKLSSALELFEKIKII